jgi:hypothetical protein
VEHGLEVWFELESTADLERAVRFGQGHPVGPGFRTACMGASKEGGALPMVETTRRLISRLPDSVLRLWTMEQVPEVLPSTGFSQDFDAWGAAGADGAGGGARGPARAPRGWAGEVGHAAVFGRASGGAVGEGSARSRRRGFL